MKVVAILDGNFSSEEHNELTNFGNPVFNMDKKILPMKGDYIRLDFFVKKLPDFAKNFDWKIEYRTVIDKDIIEIYLTASSEYC